MNREWPHEQSYKYKGIPGRIHRNRLQKIFNILEKVEISPTGKLADFGCSNGYLLSLIKERFFNGRQWDFYGFDNSKSLLSQAEEKRIKGAQFHSFDLNILNNNPWKEHFDIVTCLETLEHTGNYRNALVNIYNSCKAGGIIIISIPNEKGLAGLMKYFGRKLIRKDPYEKFFDKQSELKYLLYLMLNRNIEVFRNSEAKSWGPHLGFDWKEFDNFIDKNFTKNNKCKTILNNSSFAKFNLIYVMRKLL